MMNNIKTLRENAKLTQLQLGRFLGISSRELDLLETGQKPLTTVQLEKLCSLFQCPEECVLGMTDELPQQIDMSRFFDDNLKALADIGRVCNNIVFLEKLLKESLHERNYV